jgi:hypothetical protein
MDGINLAVIIEIVSKYGTLGVLMVVWWTDRKQLKEQHETNKTEIALVLARYAQDMADMRGMYESNVKLVKNYESVAGDLKEVVIMNTQAVTQLCGDIKTNQYCPNVRLEKQAKGVQG